MRRGAEARAGGARCVEVARPPGARSRRRSALAGPGDVVVVAGKGHEQGQEVDGVVHPFDDRVDARGSAARALTGVTADEPARARWPRSSAARSAAASDAGPTSW